MSSLAIVCSPEAASAEELTSLREAGMTVLRLHTSISEVSRQKTLQSLQESSGQSGPVALLVELTASSAEELAWAIKAGADMICVGGVESAAHVTAAREAAGNLAGTKLLVRVDNAQCVAHIDAILAACDGLVISRPELHSSMGGIALFEAQRRLIRSCNVAGKAVFVAGHVLQSMTTAQQPTQAEVSDVVTAVADGCDGLVLSEGVVSSTATKVLATICQQAAALEQQQQRATDTRQSTTKPLSTVEATASAAVLAAEEQQAAIIIVLTYSSATAALISKYKPAMPVAVVTRSGQAARQSLMHRGCCPLHYPHEPVEPRTTDVEYRLEWALQQCCHKGWTKAGDTVVLVYGWESGPGKTDMMRTISIPDHRT